MTAETDLIAAGVRTVANSVFEARARIARARSVLVGISGIDGSGKSTIAARVETELLAAGINTALINADPWLSLPADRFDPSRPAEHFYERGLRLNEMFEQLVVPLVTARELNIEFDAADATNRPTYRRASVAFRDVDVVVLEGIFLFKREYQGAFDVRVWVECSYETAFDRSLARGQEGLPPELARLDYERVYHAAQRVHDRLDNPRACTQVRINNERTQP